MRELLDVFALVFGVISLVAIGLLVIGGLAYRVAQRDRDAGGDDAHGGRDDLRW